MTGVQTCALPIFVLVLLEALLGNVRSACIGSIPTNHSHLLVSKQSSRASSPFDLLSTRMLTNRCQYLSSIALTTRRASILLPLPLFSRFLFFTHGNVHSSDSAFLQQRSMNMYEPNELSTTSESDSEYLVDPRYCRTTVKCKRKALKKTIKLIHGRCVVIYRGSADLLSIAAKDADRNSYCGTR